MIDLFATEEQVLAKANSYIAENCEKDTCSIEDYQKLTKEYARILKQLRRMTKVSDKTTVELNQDKITLLCKIHIDELTGMYNRRFFDTELLNAVEHCHENQVKLGILMLDVDFFKQYNDTYGHSAGDECLRLISKTIRNEVEATNGFAARFGGEEFVVVIKDIQSDPLKSLAEGILKAIQQLNIPHKKNQDRKVVTISIGGFCGMVANGTDCKDYVEHADVALYQSKQLGRNRYTLYVKDE